MKTKIKSLLFCVLLCYALLPMSCYAETMYQVSATDLATLIEDSTQLSQDNKQLQNNLESSMKDLEVLQSQLSESRKNLESLKAELLGYQSLSQTALQSSEETLKSLQETQQSLRKLEAKVKSKIKLGVEGTVDNNVHADANLRLSWQSSGYDIDVRANQSKQSISATRWF